jgi:hypothetical protein
MQLMLAGPNYAALQEYHCTRVHARRMHVPAAGGEENDIVKDDPKVLTTATTLKLSHANMWTRFPTRTTILRTQLPCRLKCWSPCAWSEQGRPGCPSTH